MKYSGLPAAMWMLYKKPFREGLVSNLGFTAAEAKTIAKAAGPDYKAIISKLPEFEKGDRFVTNIVNCALLVAFIKNMSRRPSVEELTVFYEKAMTNPFTKMFCRKAVRTASEVMPVAPMPNIPRKAMPISPKFSKRKSTHPRTTTMSVSTWPAALGRRSASTKCSSSKNTR